MTIVFSITTKDFILMSADSAITVSYENAREYETGEKSYFFDGVGCVTTWGSKDHNKIGSYLSQVNISPGTHDISDLSKLVSRYLIEEFCPRELNLDDVGYHVGGFDKNGHPRLFHIFWGFDRPRIPEQRYPKYAIYDHSPIESEPMLLYNGRNDLAQLVINIIIAQIKNGQDTRFNLSKHDNFIYLTDFINRFASELTPEVGPPFNYYLISPKNKIIKFNNPNILPIDHDIVSSAIKSLD